MRSLLPELVATPTAPYVSLAAAKAHLRVDHDEEDVLIASLVAAAVQHLDGFGGVLGRALLRQSWRQFLPFWPASRSVELALAPVLSVDAVTVRSDAGAPMVLDPASWRLVGGASAAPRLLLGLDATLPVPSCAPDAIAITFSAGYGDTDEALPPALRTAILLMVGDLYRFRDGVQIGQAAAVPMSTTVDRLIAPFRRMSL